jgi:membrane-associated phospholipid phosphatase
MRHALALPALIWLLPLSQLAQAQGAYTDSARGPLTPRSVLRPTMGAGSYVKVGAAVLAGSALLSLSDRHLAYEMQKLRSKSGDELRRASVLASSLGGAGPITASVAMWGVGNLAHTGYLAGLGEESTHAVLLSGVLTAVIKGVAGRARPSASDDPDPDDYSPGHGFRASQRASFPSGHTSAAFAMATVMSHELSDRFPCRRWMIRSVFYGAASAVALSRVYQHAHWPSDVLTGAAVGALSGMRVLSTHEGPGSRAPH